VFRTASPSLCPSRLIYANAALECYPSSQEDGVPRVPDIVVPVNGTGGDAGTLNTTTDRITQTLNLPTNVERCGSPKLNLD
jgi:hypothetical protein